MIQPIRRAHRWTIAGLALLLPALLTASLSVRERHPIEDPISVGAEPPPALGKTLQTFERELAPDLLIYWSSSLPSDDQLPAGAVFLGALHGARFRQVPPPSHGYFLLYSLAHRRLVSSVILSKP
ncbi:MAG: hypothetical protein FJW26_21080 [Acidimicrobiia bacterium]|nr:hypothetical protein [Acidimicrobiia bacterium]